MVYAIPPLLRKQLEFKEPTSGHTFHFQCLEVFSELVEVPRHFIVVPPPQVKKFGSSYVAGSVTPWEPQISLFFCGGLREDDGRVFVGILIDCPPDRRQLGIVLTVFLALLLVSCSYYLSVSLFILEVQTKGSIDGQMTSHKHQL